MPVPPTSESVNPEPARRVALNLGQLYTSKNLGLGEKIPSPGRGADGQKSF